MEAGPTTSGYPIDLNNELLRMQLQPSAGAFISQLKTEAVVKNELSMSLLEQQNKGKRAKIGRKNQFFAQKCGSQ